MERRYDQADDGLVSETIQTAESACGAASRMRVRWGLLFGPKREENHAKDFAIALS